MGLYQNVNEDASGNAFVNLNDSSGVGITSTTVSGKQGLDVNILNSIDVGVPDKTAFTYGTSIFQPVGGVFQDTSPALTAGQSGAVRLTADRALHINIRDAAGNELGATNASGIFVRPGDGTNSQAYSATSEAFTQIRQGGNIASVTASNELKVIDTSATAILALMKPATSTLSQVTLSNASQTALASNAARKGMSFYNLNNKISYLAFAATATVAAFTVAIQPNGYAEWMADRVYTGVVSVICPNGSTGTLVATELT